MADETDLEAYWSDVRTSPALITVHNGTGRVDVAAAKAAHDAAKVGVPASAAEKVIDQFLGYWRAEVLAGGIGSLIELVLEDYNLSTSELDGFIRALPQALLQRIIDQGAASSSARGIHALLAIEQHRRRHTGNVQDYILHRDPDRVLLVEIRRLGGQHPITFRLDETFNMADLP